jgi:hypothetical protein
MLHIQWKKHIKGLVEIPNGKKPLKRISNGREGKKAKLK